MKPRWVLILIFYVVFLGNCKEKKDLSTKKKKTSRSLLKIPTHQLLPPALRKKWGKFRIGTQEVQEIQLARSGKQWKHFQLYKDTSQWWIVAKHKAGESQGQFFQQFPQKEIFAELRKAKKTEAFPSINIKTTHMKFSLFGKDHRFLARVTLQLAEGASEPQWILYRAGNIFQLPFQSGLTKVMKQLFRDIRRLSTSNRWLYLPLRSTTMDFRLARKIGMQLTLRRAKLKRCFKKKSFPRSTGMLRMKLRFQNDGKVKRLVIESKAHKKHKLVWCIWWFAKRWEIEPFPLQEIEYRLRLPPQGP